MRHQVQIPDVQPSQITVSGGSLIERASSGNAALQPSPFRELCGVRSPSTAMSLPPIRSDMRRCDPKKRSSDDRRSYFSWRATADEDGHYSFAVAVGRSAWMANRAFSPASDVFSHAADTAANARCPTSPLPNERLLSDTEWRKCGFGTVSI